MSCTIKPMWDIFLPSCGAALAAGINPVMVVITAVTATASHALRSLVIFCSFHYRVV
ncbi:Uncharacterised protein [Klebsiella pneumoniae]|nr:Uncharacterised protein [Klebsiella pneumoniae]VGB01985.1 Uncharacterised protein [Klebsiella pneumoniae]